MVRGDISGTVVHPFFVHALAAFGMHFCADIGDSPKIVQLRAKHGQRALEQVAEVNGGTNAEVSVHVLLSLAAMTLHARWTERARQFLTKACIALNAANIQFIPATGRPPGLTEDVSERLVVLSQVIYLENYLFLAVDGTEPKMTARIEKEFRREVEVRVLFPVPCGVV